MIGIKPESSGIGSDHSANNATNATRMLFKKDWEKFNYKLFTTGREPWSNGYGRRLTFQMLWVRIPAPYTGWTFFHICLL